MKNIILTGILMACSLPAVAQCEEVKGVETNNVELGELDENGLGFEFINTNSYPVTIEAEAWDNCVGQKGDNIDCRDSLRKTKYKVLSAHETYVWRPGFFWKYRSNYYVKLKAFRCS